MAWITRKTPLDEIDVAGTALISRRSTPIEIEQANEIVNEWRAAHAFPLNTIQMRLRDKVREIDRRRPFVSQRIKRLPAIKSKLRRLKNVRLSVMQDIGGCRAVVASNNRVIQLADLYKSGRILHKLEREDDYIAEPKSNGYRSLHLIYRYHSNMKPEYNGQRIEIQLRSRLQHAWATAVETVDLFTAQALKINQGSRDFARFFSLMGNWIALREKSVLVPGTPSSHAQLRLELQELSTELNVITRLKAFHATALHLRKSKRMYHILQLNQKERRVRVTSYSRNDIDRASSKYAELEKLHRSEPHIDILLTSVYGAKLQQAYPNYFADTAIFLRELNRALK